MLRVEASREPWWVRLGTADVGVQRAIASNPINMVIVSNTYNLNNYNVLVGRPSGPSAYVVDVVPTPIEGSAPIALLTART